MWLLSRLVPGLSVGAEKYGAKSVDCFEVVLCSGLKRAYCSAEVYVLLGLVHHAVSVTQLVIVTGHNLHGARVEVSGGHAEGHAGKLEQVHEVVNVHKGVTDGEHLGLQSVLGEDEAAEANC
jgi:hypothetical protein